MRTIWKFAINCNSIEGSQFNQRIPMPAGSKPLCVMVQNGVPFVWCDVDPDAPGSVITFLIVGTGHGAVPPEANYLGSVIDRAYVWHVYWRT